MNPKKWTPVAFTEDSGVGWADLEGQRFDRPFFAETIKAWMNQGNELRWTSNDALAACDGAASLEPDLIIVNASRCGSTLLARMMAAQPGSILVSEPTVLTDIMTYGLLRPEAPIADMVRQAVRALGCIRFDDETRFILKLSSGATRFLPLLRQVFPRVPVVWLQRRPEEIFKSELRFPSHWIGGRHGTEPIEVRAFRKIALSFLSAKAHVHDDVLVLDYRDLPDAAWRQVAPFMGCHPDAHEIARMQRVAEYHAKSGQPWAPRSDPALDPKLLAHIEREISPIYFDLDRRRGLSAVGGSA